MRDWIDHDKVWPIDLPRSLDAEFHEAEQGSEWRRRDARTRAAMSWYGWMRTEHYARLRRCYLALGGSLLAAAGILVIGTEGFDGEAIRLTASALGAVALVLVVTMLVWRKASPPR
jgi:hypothetical protein